MSTATLAAPAAPVSEAQACAEVAAFIIERGVSHHGIGADVTAALVAAEHDAAALWDMARGDDSAELRRLCEDAAESAVLTARVAGWIRARKIKGCYETYGIAARVVASLHADRLRLMLGVPYSNYLRDMCQRVQDSDDEAGIECVSGDDRIAA